MCTEKLTREQAHDKVLRELAATWAPEDLEHLPPAVLDRMADATGKSAGELLGGQAGSCASCPGNAGMTASATEAQNYAGCLPSMGEIVEMKRATGHNWACHDNEERVCAGLCHAAREEGLDLRKGNLIRHSTWYHRGLEAAIEEANAASPRS